ncbi:sensor histidine kinase [Streptomyces broussonetiae]|uniref:sensor histidine kinase n=1 Tax=Streptomyces broussonetiae TaxID=2686304 RepID=UPI004064BF49
MKPAAADDENDRQRRPAPAHTRGAEGAPEPGIGTAASTRRRRLRTWLGENPSPHSPPFARYRWLRLLTFLLIGYTALGIGLGGGEQLADGYRFSTAVGLLLGLAQGATVVLAIWRPVPAWAASLAAALLTALLARPHLATDAPANTSWPWSTPVLLAHMVVLVLLALRTRLRGTLTALGLTVLVTGVVQGPIGATKYASTGVIAVALFSVAVLTGTALRSRSEARTQLARQTTITAEERARRALLEERSRIARELHDVVAHHMSVISIQAQVAPHLVENPSEELRENLTGIRNNALEALTELRRVLGVLRSEGPVDPEAVDDAYRLSAPGTGSAPDAPQPNLARLDALIENTRAAGADVVMKVEGEARGYPPGVELSAYRIVQEALSNVLRHAPGSSVSVEVLHYHHGICLDVINSRPSRPAPPSPGSGHGLLGMRERAAMLGGHVVATGDGHGGFRVTAFLPREGTPASADTGGPATSTHPPGPPHPPGQLSAPGPLPSLPPAPPASDPHRPEPPTGEQAP